MKKLKNYLINSLIFITIFAANTVFALPDGFVYLHDVAPTIEQEMRYAGSHNFIGRPITGYKSGKCILTRPAANALLAIQTELMQSGLSLKVYDCYRPQMAVNDFIEWSKDVKQQTMKNEFYPNVNKADFFTLGYVARKSGHTRGSTVDLSIVSIPHIKPAHYHTGDRLTSCLAPYHDRFPDTSIDMGTGFDCMDLYSHPSNQKINMIAYEHRMLLQKIMAKYGFDPIEEEWWHFTLKDEPYSQTYFNFPVQ